MQVFCPRGYQTKVTILNKNKNIYNLIFNYIIMSNIKERNDDEEINSLKRFIAERFTITEKIDEFINQKVNYFNSD